MLRQTGRRKARGESFPKTHLMLTPAPVPERATQPKPHDGISRYRATLSIRLHLSHSTRTKDRRGWRQKQKLIIAHIFGENEKRNWWLGRFMAKGTKSENGKGGVGASFLPPAATVYCPTSQPRPYRVLFFSAQFHFEPWAPRMVDPDRWARPGGNGYARGAGNFSFTFRSLPVINVVHIFLLPLTGVVFAQKRLFRTEELVGWCHRKSEENLCRELILWRYSAFYTLPLKLAFWCWLEVTGWCWMVSSCFGLMISLLTSDQTYKYVLCVREGDSSSTAQRRLRRTHLDVQLEKLFAIFIEHGSFPTFDSC